MDDTGNVVPTSTTVTNWDQPLIKGVLSNADGTGSASRVGTLLVIIAAIVWVSYIVFRNNSIPDLTGLALYETSIIGILYGVGRAADVFIRNKQP